MLICRGVLNMHGHVVFMFHSPSWWLGGGGLKELYL